MIDGTSEIDPVLDAMHQRLEKSNTLKEMLGVPDLSEAEKLLDKMKGMGQGKIGRSEHFITPEQAQQFDQYVESTRKLLFENGKDKEQDPDAAAEVGQEGSPTLEELRNLFEDEKGKVAVMGYKDLKGPVFELDSVMAKLDVFITDPERQIEIRISSDRRFNIDILFKDIENPQRKALQYDSGERPIEEMTSEEFEIARYGMSRYIDAANVQEDSPTKPK